MTRHPFAAFLAHLDGAPEAPAVLQGDAIVTRAGLAARAGAIARHLARRGVGPEAPRVLVNTANSPDMVALVLAIWSLRALPMFLSARSPEAHRAAVEARLRPALTVDGALLESLGGTGELPRPDLPPGADASVVFTSGSSGPPKGVVQKGGTLASGVERIARTLGYAPQERILVPIPFAHDYGWGQMLSGLAGGHVLILPAKDTLVEISRTITAQAPTVLAGVPSLYAGLLLGVSDFENARTGSLRLLTSTGSHFSEDLYRMLAARVPQARILRNYGLTETYRGCCLHPDHAAARPGSVGRPVEGVRIAIVSPDGRVLPPGEEGEIVHLGAGIFDRYLDDPEATARTRRLLEGEPAVFTGDIGRLDAEGFLTVLGRRDRLVKSLDVRVNLGDVEEALARLEGVSAAAVIARPHPMTGVELVAFCTGRPGLAPRDVRRSANRALPTHMRPRQVVLLPELPRTPVGKVDYPALAGAIQPLEESDHE